MSLSLSQELLSRLEQDRSAIEETLKALVVSGVPTVHSVCTHTLNAGGKRLRPGLVLMAAEATGRPFDRQRALRLGACMEMVHMATLIHDDVIDHAATRRGQPTAANVFGNTPAILSGDVLLARAMTVLAEDGDLAIIREVSRAVVDMAEGEALEVMHRGNLRLSLDEHMPVLRLKPATFIECCCKLGGMVEGASKEVCEALGSYGYTLGMAFQVVDDLLDFEGNEEKTGKPVATDFREGCATLPLIYFLEVADSDQMVKVQSWFGECCSDEEVTQLTEWLGMDALGRARETGSEFADLARSALSTLPHTAQRDLLQSLCDYVTGRDH